ncbi:1 3-beta-glucanosyltransferase gel4 [Coemansia sp. IMI 209128]|nr:1 3-beta-glucanosyltransferase gel4 [Coemansia sp. RSA 2530]KAJ2702975.1 1 3-beta-glucanosyltransferase gel4 [Coemansia sp. IMI 209128]
MKFSLLSAASVGVLCAAMSAAALDPIVIKGSKFFNEKTGEQFFFKGMAYQPRAGFKGETMDPLADTVGCKRDIEVFKDLGINSIRVYEVDYTKNHDTCMKLLEDAGIYLMLDMPSPKYSINRKEPYWDHDMMSHWTAKVDAFSKYPNLIAWLAGNEVANDVETTPSAAFVKAAIRDMKAYLKKKGHKTPVGYADNDDMHIRMNLINYFNCGDKETRADFYGVNIYRWCGDDSNFKTSGYEDVTKNMTDYTIPSLLTEYGCNLVRPRTFPELKSLYGSDMANTFSGGIMYEYSEEDNKYGIVSVNYGDSKVEKNGDYENLKKALKDAKPKTIKSADYKPSGKDSVCPKTSNTWLVKSEVLPPTPSAARCKCMMDSLGCTLKKEELTADEGKALGEAVGFICGKTSCSDISYDTAKGNYGSFVACEPAQRSAWAINKNYLNQNKAKCEVKGADTMTVSSPKQGDQAACLKEKDDIGNVGSPSTNTGDDKSTSGGSSKTDSEKEKEDEESETTSSKNSSALLSVQPVATLLASAVALFYLF